LLIATRVCFFSNRPLAVSMWRTSHSINLQVAKNEVQSFIDLLANKDRLVVTETQSASTTNDADGD
jgi:hypothetical protein